MKVLRWPALEKAVGLSRTHTDRLEKSGKFPRRVKLGPRSVGWLEDEIDAWIADRADERAEPSAP